VFPTALFKRIECVLPKGPNLPLWGLWENVHPSDNLNKTASMYVHTQVILEQQAYVNPVISNTHNTENITNVCIEFLLSDMERKSVPTKHMYICTYISLIVLFASNKAP
jgi:hypothetical protein